jgi:hypothetical protein
MKAFANIALAAVAAVVLVPAHAAEVNFYGRAGGTVGAERIQQIARTASPTRAAEFDPGYGRAGGAVVTAQAKEVKSTPVAVATEWYGRAGRPLPFGG